ncbi:hypothetical protein PVAP13_3NG277941, partial [Panicum virgatum]
HTARGGARGQRQATSRASQARSGQCCQDASAQSPSRRQGGSLLHRRHLQGDARQGCPAGPDTGVCTYEGGSRLLRHSTASYSAQDHLKQAALPGPCVRHP